MRHFGHICEDRESDIYQTYRTFDANTFTATIADIHYMLTKRSGERA